MFEPKIGIEMTGIFIENWTVAPGYGGDDLEFYLERDRDVPLYVQIKNNIKRFIETGAWERGKRLPTERDMAKQLNVSRNTVSMAYKELEAEGVLVSHQGRGTFVADLDDSIQHESRKERLLKIIDIAMEEASQLGFNIDEYLAITHVRAREKKELLNRVKIAFIECNQEQVDYFANEIRLDSGVSINTILLDDFLERPDHYKKALEDVDIVISTFFHLAEIKKVLGTQNQDILAIALELQLETVVKIARLKPGSDVGLVCISKNFANKFFKSLDAAGIDHLNVKFNVTEDPGELKDFISSVDEVIVSPGRKKEVEKLIDDDKELVEVIFKPDRASINLLKATLMDLKQKIS